MTTIRTAILLSLVGLIGSSACATQDAFMNVAHRRNYAITNAEIKQLQFYLSRQILARDVSAGGLTDDPNTVLLVNEGTRGAAVDVGDTWIRVSFEKGGAGVVFATDTTRQDDGYWLATKVEGEEGYRKVRDLREPIVFTQGRRFKIVRGADAFLLVKEGDIDNIIKTRRHIRGRRPQ
jgi:hypothetical protein